MRHFFTILRKETSLQIYLLLAFVCQIIFGLHFFESIFLSIIYSIGLFVFMSLAYSIVYNTVDYSVTIPSFRKSKIQIVLICIVVLLGFSIYSGQFPKSSVLFEISKPIRYIFYESILKFGFSSTVNGIIVNNIISVFLPLIILLYFSRSAKEFFVDRIDLKVLFLLFIIYLPIILFSGKSLNAVINDTLIYFLIAAIPEEFLFRGLFQSRLESVSKNAIYAILITSIVFGLIHLPINIKTYGLTVGVATCIGNNAFGGLFIGYLFYKTRSIWTVIIFHLISGIALS